MDGTIGMEPRIETIAAKKLVGLHRDMSLVENETGVLWRQFMPRRAEITNRTTSDFLSMQVYRGQPETVFSPDTVFTKWAAVEVSDHNSIPDGMEPYLLRGGLYAVFPHRGPAASAPQIMRFIFGEWLPNANHVLDGREHFEVLPADYNPMDPDAREEICIPVRPR